MSESSESSLSESLPEPQRKDPLAAAAPMTAADLGKAFARMLDESAHRADDQPAADQSENQAHSESAEKEDISPPTPRQILEALLFVGSSDNEPLSTERLCQALQGVEPAELADMVRNLNQQYSEEARPYEVTSQGGGYRLVLRREFQRLRDKFYGKVRQARLSQAAIEVLAIVAYNQPIAAEQVAELRGTPSGAILSQLVRRQLLRIDRTTTKPHKTSYHTTDRFLDLFHLSHVGELPRPVEAQIGSSA